MILALLAGAGVGLGLVLVIGGLVPARPPLALALERLHRPATFSAGTTRLAAPSAATRVVHRLASTLGLQRLMGRSVTADLRLTGQSVEDHLATRVLVALLGLALPPATAVLMLVGGVTIPIVMPGAASALLCAAGFFVPAITLRSEAAERRHSFRHALSSYLDLVAVTLAGGAGVETALQDGADTGQGWAYAELRQALLTSRLLGETPWAGMDRLGRELGIVELQELAASAALAGEDGARVRGSIAAKARALRSRGISDVEASAQAATERMSLPIVLLLLGFMVFILYPAIARIIGL